MLMVKHMATLADVARRAQVSKATASRVLNGLGPVNRISPQTILAVQEAAIHLGYLNGTPPPRRWPSSNTIGVLLSADALIGAGGDYLHGIFGGITKKCRDMGYHVLISHELHSWESMGIDLITDRRIDSLIIFHWMMNPGYTLIDLDELDIPMVVIGDPARPTTRPVIALDYDSAFVDAFDSIKTNGHKKIGFIRSENSMPTQNADPQSPENREKALRKQADCHGAQVTTLVIPHPHKGEHSSTSREVIITHNLQFLRHSLNQLNDCTLLVCYNDIIAITLMRVLLERGEAVPEERSVIGFDDNYADLAIPPLATISYRHNELGRRAAEVAIELAQHPDRAAKWVGKRESVPARFMQGATLNQARK